MDNDFPCVWIPEVRKSGRISTMFYGTSCGKTGVLQDNAEYCYLCGSMLDVVDREAVREHIADEMLADNGGPSR